MAAGNTIVYRGLLLMLVCLAGSAQTVDEYQVKAAFLYNFAKFAEWPAETVQSPKASITTCVLGKDPFGHWLKDTIEGRAIDSHTLVLRNINSAAEADSCQILFVSSTESKHTWTALAAAKKTGVLTIGECSYAIENGAVINFILDGDRVRFEINPRAAELAKVRISSRLLSLARIREK